MGTRLTKFSCDTCGDSWWEKFEHLSKTDIIEFTETTKCPDCDSTDWTVTQVSQFAGGPIKPNPPDKRGKRIREFTCNDCRTEFHAWIGELSSTSLLELANTIECPGCASDDWRLRDGYKFISGSDLTAPAYYTMVNSPENA